MFFILYAQQNIIEFTFQIFKLEKVYSLDFFYSIRDDYVFQNTFKKFYFYLDFNIKEQSRK